MSHRILGFAVTGMIAAGLFLVGAATPTASAEQPGDTLSGSGQHRLFHGAMPPGQIAATRQIMTPYPMPPYFQPVAFQGPPGTRFSLALMGSFETPVEDLMAGLMVGRVYRFQVTGIPGAEGAELFPSIEMVDRTFPPPGLATRYPIPIQLDQDDMSAALDGQLVTRVIYLEDPQTAVPLQQPKTGSVPIDVAESQDPLETADRLGRVVAILRIGSLAPPTVPELMPSFIFGSPPWAPIFQPEPPSTIAP